MIQQLVKLSMARRVATPFYLTLDADVICIKPIYYVTLIRDSRSIARVFNQDPQSRAASHHANWYRMSADLLGVPASKRTHGITPAVLSSEAVLKLFAYLEARAGDNHKRAESQLLKELNWTEYALYYTYLEHFGLFETYHTPVRDISGNNIWQRWNPDAWDPAMSFRAENEFWFSVLQSNNPDLKVKSIVKRIRSHFREIGERSPV